MMAAEMTCWFKQQAPGVEKWRRGSVATTSSGVPFWVISDDKGKEAVRLGNAQPTIRDDVLQLDRFVHFGQQKYRLERWLLVFDKAHAR